MAADVKARQDRNATIAFTLPISCQVCLGKVKQPVLCPNNHVFCSQCMDVWLQRNKQCPACRVHINPGNPIKKILGGLSDCGEDKERLSNPELRKTRFDLLYREYEEEFQRLEAESQLLKTENEVLQQQLQKTGGGKFSGSRDSSQSKQSDTNGILVLNKKLQDAQKLYEKVKSELSKVKQENNSLKDENVNLNRENQKLRQEIANRSPHRYGRYTVATLETKVQSYEKEVEQLHKALEKSDRFIEELQNKVGRNETKETSKFDSDRDFIYPSKSARSYTSKIDTATSSAGGLISSNHPSKRQLFNEDEEDSDVGSSHRGYVNGESYKLQHEPGQSYKSYDLKTSSKSRNGKSTKKVTFDLPKNRNETVSFDLEMPSPLKNHSLSNGTSPSPVKGVLKNGKKSNLLNGDDSLNLSKPLSLDDSYTNKPTANRHGSEKDSERFYNLKSSSGSRYARDDTDVYRQSNKSDLDISGLSESFNLDYPGRGTRKYDQYDRELDDTEAIQTELDELDISMTPDLTDCMKLLNRAEKKVHSETKKPSYQVTEDPLMDIYKPSDDLRGKYTSHEPKVDSHNTKSDLLYGDYKSTSGGYTDSDNYTSKYYSSSGSKSRYDIPDKSGTSNRTDTDLPLSSYSLSNYKSSASDNVHASDLPLSQYSASSSNYKMGPTDSIPVSSNTANGRYSLPSDGVEGKSIPSGIDKYHISSVHEDFTAPSSSKHSLPMTNLSDKFRAASVNTFGPSSDSTTSKYNGTDTQINKPSFENGISRSGHFYSSKSVSSPEKNFSGSRPLIQSGFGRSPSVDNLFISSKTSTQSTGSRYATAEDIPSNYRPRRSLPVYTSSAETGRLPTGAASDVESGSRDFLMSALPPKPVRTRSQSDLGTSVSSLASSSAYQRGKGNNSDLVTSVYSYSVPNTTDTLPSYSSTSQSIPTSVTVPYAVSSSVPSTNPYRDVGKYAAPLPAGVDLASGLTTNRLTNSNNPLSLSGPVKAKTGYSYTDFDLGVNPKTKNKLDLPLTTRVRSNSLDIPVDKLASYDSSNNKPYSGSYDSGKPTYSYDTSKPLYSHIDSVRPSESSSYHASAVPDSAYTISLTGASQTRSAALEDNIPSSSLDPGISSRYKGSSMSSSTSYLPSSLTSVTSSSTFSTAGTTSSSSYQPAYPTSSSTYMGGGGGKSLDPINEASGKGYSYLSNNSSLGDLSRSDSFLPEPKKRLFDSADDLDLSLSPIKTTRKI